MFHITVRSFESSLFVETFEEFFPFLSELLLDPGEFFDESSDGGFEVSSSPGASVPGATGFVRPIS